MSTLFKTLVKPTTIEKVNVQRVAVGDLIFYESVEEGMAATVPLGGGRVHHVEICTQAAQLPPEAQAAIITGQVNREADEGRKLDALKQTRSTQLTPKREDRLVVLHCTNEALRLKAAKYAERWCKLVIPFNRRGTQPDTNDKDVKKHRELFTESGRFRAIRYAARRSESPQEPDDEPKPTSGMFCSHFVAACYQVAGLEGVVKAAGKGVKVQDKKGKLDLDKVPEQYRGVVQKFKHYQQTDEANIVKKDGVAGITFWEFEKAGGVDAFAWAKFITEGMEVDCKKIMPRALLACLLADKEGWVLVGAIMPQ